MRSTSSRLLATRRSSVVMVGAMLLALAVVVLASTLAPKKADAATRIVTKTFSASGQIRIPEGSVFPTPPNDECTGATRGSAAPYPSERSVGAFPAGSQIRDVNLTLKNYSYNDSPDDADVLLVHRGVNRTVMSDVGGAAGVSNITLVLDDEVTFFLPDSGNLGDGGRFKPRNAGTLGDEFPSPAPTQNSASALSGFDNQNPNGTWSLFVRDDTSQDCGKFGGGWSIRIRAAVPV